MKFRFRLGKTMPAEARTGLWPLLYVEWYHEPARTRTIIVGKCTERHKFPAVAFGVARSFGFFLTLSFFIMRGKRLFDTERMQHVFPGCVVCLGNRATARIRSGLLDPRQAFWNTDFGNHGFNGSAMLAGRECTRRTALVGAVHWLAMWLIAWSAIMLIISAFAGFAWLVHHYVPNNWMKFFG